MGSNDIFNNFPSDWYSTPLGQLVKENNGIIQTGPFGSQLHAEDYVLVGTPSIMPKNISVNGVIDTDIARIRASDLERLSRYQVKTGDIIYSRRGDVEKCALISERENGWLCGTGCILIRLGNSDISPEFLHAYLSHPFVRAWIVRHAIGATMPNLNTTILSELPILVPPKKARKCIKENWTNLTKKILINFEINQTLEKIAQALFKSWFVDFEPVKAKMAALQADGSQEDATLAAMTAISGKDTDTLAVFEREHPEQYAELKTTAELFPSAMQESELGAIPAGWNISNIKDNVDVRDGTHASPKASDSGYHLVTSKNITSGYLDRRSCYYISDMDYHEVNKRSRVSCGDILISMIGTVGALYFVAENNVDYAIKNIGLIRTSERQDLQAFIFYHLKSNNGVNYINSRLAGTTQKYLSLKQLREIPIVMPTQDVLAAFNKKIFLHEIHANQEITETLANIRDTLLPKLLSGEITLPEAEQAVSEAENV